MAENATAQEPWTRGLGVAATILVLLSVFVVQWGYYIICEMTMDGASPGKRALGLRVIRDNGLPIGFVQSMLRNLVRVVDFLPWAYGVGLVAAFASRRSQRLGDLAAGTLVVKLGAARAGPAGASCPALAPARPPAATCLLPEERELLHRFIARSGKMLPEARRALASADRRPAGAAAGPEIPQEPLDDESLADPTLRARRQRSRPGDQRGLRRPPDRGLAAAGGPLRARGPPRRPGEPRAGGPLPGQPSPTWRCCAR